MGPALTERERQSALITAMRFPLIVLVLYEHAVGAFAGVNSAYGFVSELISHHICPIAVCWFFVFSGFLFFQHTPEGFSFSWILGKWKKRIRTLLIPYLLWNLLFILIILLKNFCFEKAGLGTSQEELSAVHAGPLFWFLTGPADFPLWYLLALIKMTLLAPLVWWLSKEMPVLFPILLTALYLLGWGIPHVVSAKPLFYFSMGAWMGINQMDLRRLCRSFRIPASIAAAVLLVVATWRSGQNGHEFWARLCWPFVMITFLNLIDRLIDNPARKERLSKLSAPVFFIYAAHEIYLLGWAKGLFVRIFGDSPAGTWIKFLFAPFVALLVCLVLYQVLNRLMPKTLAFCCGGRTKPAVAP